jgi:hypothetical protein
VAVCGSGTHRDPRLTPRSMSSATTRAASRSPRVCGRPVTGSLSVAGWQWHVAVTVLQVAVAVDGSGSGGG